MRTWTSDELERIAAADELKIAPVRRDGRLRNPVTVWVVRHGDDLYVRSVNGRGASWSAASRRVTKATSRPAASTETFVSSRPTT
jgi:hypothetical protein